MQWRRAACAAAEPLQKQVFSSLTSGRRAGGSLQCCWRCWVLFPSHLAGRGWEGRRSTGLLVLGALNTIFSIIPGEHHPSEQRSTWKGREAAAASMLCPGGGPALQPGITAWADSGGGWEVPRGLVLPQKPFIISDGAPCFGTY